MSCRTSPSWKVPSWVSPFARCQLQLAHQPDGLGDQERTSPGHHSSSSRCEEPATLDSGRSVVTPSHSPRGKLQPSPTLQPGYPPGNSSHRGREVDQ